MAMLCLSVAFTGACASHRTSPAARGREPEVLAPVTVAKAGAAEANRPVAVLERTDFRSLALFLGQALVRRDASALRQQGFDLGADADFPAKWLVDPAEQGQLTLDWVLVDFRLDAPNPISATVGLVAYLQYAVFVFPDRRLRYFTADWRGSDGSEGQGLRFDPGFAAETQHLLAAGFGEDCQDADSLRPGEIDLQKAAQTLVPLVDERVPLRPVCHRFIGSRPPMPRSGWQLEEVRILAFAHGRSTVFSVGAFIVPDGPRYRLSAYDPLYWIEQRNRAIAASRADAGGMATPSR
jgi:hypothetical protein